MKATGDVLDESAYKALHPNVSFAPGFVPVDADRVVVVEPPQVTPFQRAVRDGIVQTAGKWVEAWRIEDLPLDEKNAVFQKIVAERWAEIKELRTKLERGGVRVGSSWFQSDADSRIKFLGLKDKARDAMMSGGTTSTVLYQAGAPIRWKTFDNSFVTVTVGLALDIVEAVGTLDALAFAKAEEHRIAMVTSGDPSNYDYSAGWPATYQG